MVIIYLTPWPGQEQRAADTIERLSNAMGIRWSPELGGAKYAHRFDDQSPAEAREAVLKALESVDPEWRDCLHLAD